ncbi:hypothetical protein MTR62_01705 [Novosphingobium sp. 1949]|uniref:Uncharacterized protein n=1 Tax=Novosphingobium organovorum TaxID=2930092 RepID=A0ABT0B8Q3_9SPHN|nr:hypothetical protein [Novosphingobium organovorum]MCJ2181427.1 hypothetical protein [Novosphingobium organovorum]
MPRRALIERRPWLLCSLALAFLYGWVLLTRTPLAGLYLMALSGAPFGLLAAYALLRHKGSDTQGLGLMLGLEGVATGLSSVFPDATMMVMLFGWAAGLTLFLRHRAATPDLNRRIGAAALLLGTPAMCYVAASQSDASVPLFYGLLLGALAASAWMSTFAQGRVGIGGVLVVFGGVLQITVPDYLSAQNGQAPIAWLAFYFGNLVLATGVTGELRLRHARALTDWDNF